jgi:hypothetical protein
MTAMKAKLGAASETEDAMPVLTSMTGGRGA